MPGSTTSNLKLPKIYWVYVLESLKDKKRYIGYTINLKKRLSQHSQGKNFSTRHRIPFRLIYIEGCSEQYDAKRREKYFKTTGGRRFLAKRLRNYYSKKKNIRSCPTGYVGF